MKGIAAWAVLMAVVLALFAIFGGPRMRVAVLILVIVAGLTTVFVSTYYRRQR